MKNSVFRFSFLALQSLALVAGGRPCFAIANFAILCRHP